MNAPGKVAPALLTLVLVVTAQPASAQQTADDPPRTAQTYVTFSIQGITHTRDLSVWVDRLGVLAEHDELLAVNVEEDAQGIRFRAEFAFDDVEAFRSWFAAGRTESMIEDLKRDGVNVRSSLAFRHRPAARQVE